MRAMLGVLVGAVAVVAAGCGPVVGVTDSPTPGAASPAALYGAAAEVLLSAREGVDIGDALAKPPPELLREGPAQPTRKAEPGKARRFSARAGVLMAASAEDVDREVGIVAGVGYDLAFGGSGSTKLELGAEYGMISDSSGEVTSSVAVIAGAVRLGLGKSGLYVLGGGSLLVDQYEDAANETSGTSYIPVAEAGVGMRAAAGKVDIRASYMVLVGSENVPGLMTFKAGLAF